MSLLQYVGRLYSLDTLDTRFTTSAKTPPSRNEQTTSSEESRRARNGQDAVTQGAKPPKWRTPEFGVYGLVILVAVLLMFKTVYDVSQPSHSNFSSFETLLSPGWIPGRKVDNSDQQYAGFRDNVTYLFLVLILHPLLRRLFNLVYTPGTNGSEDIHLRIQNGSGSPLGRQRSAADQRLNQRLTFDLCFGIVWIIALHGFSGAKVLTILYINFALATKLNREYVPVATWVFNIGVLFANELGHGYPYETIATSILPWGAAEKEGTANQNWGTYLDSYGGLIPRWEVLFNITVLRLISFNFDYYWSLNQSGSSPLEKQLDPANLSERDRVSIPAKATDYTLRNYLSYALYSPLYLAGPILTFNDYISQSRYPALSNSPKRTLLYGVRFLIALLSMELMIHYIYVVAISKSSPKWEIYTPFQLSMLGYFNLHHIWLKLLLPWRFFRWWSLLDGIDPPENVVRCMSDNYSAFAFWRGWHRSYNRWLIRYIYIPLGGSGAGASSNSSGGGGGGGGGGEGGGRKGYAKYWSALRSVGNLLVVFTFVAMWHDIQLRLLVWGWLITLFVLPELLASLAFPPSKWKDSPETYRIICGVGAVLNILMMMMANLVGFALGLDGLKGLVLGIAGSWWGWGFMAVACGALFTGAQVMFELREGERRGGVVMKC